MSKADKLIDAMRRSPAGNWTISDVQRLCAQIGWECLAPANGSHWKITVPGARSILTVPARRPIKPVYIRKIVAAIDEGDENG